MAEANAAPSEPNNAATALSNDYQQETKEETKDSPSKDTHGSDRSPPPYFDLPAAAAAAVQHSEGKGKGNASSSSSSGGGDVQTLLTQVLLRLTLQERRYSLVLEEMASLHDRIETLQSESKELRSVAAALQGQVIELQNTQCQTIPTTTAPPPWPPRPDRIPPPTAYYPPFTRQNLSRSPSPPPHLPTDHSLFLPLSSTLLPQQPTPPPAASEDVHGSPETSIFNRIQSVDAAVPQAQQNFYRQQRRQSRYIPHPAYTAATTATAGNTWHKATEEVG